MGTPNGTVSIIYSFVPYNLLTFNKRECVNTYPEFMCQDPEVSYYITSKQYPCNAVIDSSGVVSIGVNLEYGCEATQCTNGTISISIRGRVSSSGNKIINTSITDATAFSNYGNFHLYIGGCRSSNCNHTVGKIQILCDISFDLNGTVYTMDRKWLTYERVTMVFKGQ